LDVESDVGTDDEEENLRLLQAKETARRQSVTDFRGWSGQDLKSGEHKEWFNIFWLKFMNISDITLLNFWTHIKR